MTGVFIQPLDVLPKSVMQYRSSHWYDVANHFFIPLGNTFMIFVLQRYGNALRYIKYYLNISLVSIGMIDEKYFDILDSQVI